MALSNITYLNVNSALLYSSNTNWFEGTYNAANTDQTGTLSTTKTNNANVTFIFPQAANAVYYYGIRRCCGGLYAICADCDPNDPVTNNTGTGFQTIDALNSTDNGQNPPVVLWSAVWPEPGIHTIILTNQLDDRFPEGNSEITLASFAIQVVDGTDPTTSSASSIGPTTSSASPTGPKTSSASLTGSIGPTTIPSPSLTSSSPPGPSSQNPSAGGLPLKQFLAGFLGGLTVIAGIIVAVFLCIRRRRRNGAKEQAQLETVPRTFITTHTFSQPSSTSGLTKSTQPYRSLQREDKLEVNYSRYSRPETLRSDPPAYEQIFPEDG